MIYHEIMVAQASFWLTFFGWGWEECWKHWATESGIGTLQGWPDNFGGI